VTADDWDGYCTRCGDGCCSEDPIDTDTLCWTCALENRREEGAAIAFGIMAMADWCQWADRNRIKKEADAKYQAAMDKLWGIMRDEKEP